MTSTLLQIRVLLNEYISLAETLIADHSGYHGLKEYALLKGIEYWHAESWNGILHEHEAQYLYTFRHFLTDQQHYNLAKQTHQLLISWFEHASDLWTLVTTILDCLIPPVYHYELDSRPQEDASEQRQKAFWGIPAH